MRIPKYQLIEDELRREIQTGKFAPGDRFYSEAELISRFDVSSITVIRAIRDLVSMGYLVREQGRGTFISRSSRHKIVEFADIEVFAGCWEDESVEVLSMEKGDDPDVRAKLRLADSEDYYEFVRVHRIKNESFLVTESHIPATYGFRSVARTAIRPSTAASARTSEFTSMTRASSSETASSSRRLRKSLSFLALRVGCPAFARRR
nr:GntR family transcriptional regulator [Olsenella sp. Marseille-P4559]